MLTYKKIYTSETIDFDLFIKIFFLNMVCTVYQILNGFFNSVYVYTYMYIYYTWFV